MFTMMNMEHVKDLWCRWRSMCSLQGSLPSIASPFWMLPIRSARTFDSGAQTSKEQRPTPVFKSLRAAPVPCQFPYFERVLAPVVGNSDDTFQWERNLKDVLFLGSTSCFLYLSHKALFFVVSCFYSLYVESRITEDHAKKWICNFKESDPFISHLIATVTL